MKKLLAGIFFIVGIIGNSAFCEERNYFFYIPSTKEMQIYFSMKHYLSEWESGKRIVDDKTFDAIYQDNIGKKTLNSLLLESFFRHTRNDAIKKQLNNYIVKNKIKTTFAQSIQKKINSTELKMIRPESGKEVVRYSYLDTEFDENINLFDFDEVSIFDGKLGVLLFNNDWTELSLNSQEQKNDTVFFLTFGGETNSMIIGFKEKSNIEFSALDDAMDMDVWKSKYPHNWKSIELKQEGVLWNSGAEKYSIAYGYGPDIIPEIDSAACNAYLYNKKEKKLYIITTFMNFSKSNIFYTERYRIFNYVLFNSLFYFLK